MAQKIDPCKLPIRSQTERWQEHRKGKTCVIYISLAPHQHHIPTAGEIGHSKQRNYSEKSFLLFFFLKQKIIPLHSILLANPHCLSHSHVANHLEDALNTQG